MSELIPYALSAPAVMPLVTFMLEGYYQQQLIFDGGKSPTSIPISLRKARRLGDLAETCQNMMIKSRRVGNMLSDKQGIY